ncbi:MAG TPA: hypothetical protein DF712_09245 [Balneola sp.]|jgi:hypothetical protein|nr:hypothetical protein [Bacteroidota bacterium]MAC06394.1 hypothetical protein [Balneola sp.]MAO78587.1 hypothetical protein [Balneola sp.]MBF63184.1 hypothetical protein [Balneola sp.]HAH51228.1 hypothetical protein [Balneola sp.]|tara:strand:- start:2693 stop:4147 length:1455 start_codon:yes stop_codon:yes gene_type:complete
MKYSAATFLSIFLFSSFLTAQQKTGFSNTDSIRTVLEYRLPDWGYSNFYLASGAFSNGLTLSKPTDVVRDQNNNTIRTDIDNKLVRFSGSVTPIYELYKESEKRFIDLRSTTSFTIQANSEDREFDQYITETNTQLNSATIEGNSGIRTFSESLIIDLKEYVVDDFFLLFTSNLFLSYSSQNFYSEENNLPVVDATSFSRNVFARPGVGIGYGRFRNVTPTIRALRLSERSQLMQLQALNNNQVLTAADHFTRFNGYTQRYDRPRKYFWDDMNNSLSNIYSDLSVFDAFYLDDVFNEALGSRYEGFEVYGGFEYQYNAQLQKVDNNINNTNSRETLILKEHRVFANLNWSKNLDLENQVSIRVSTTQFYNNEEGANFDRRNISELRAEWLKNLSDRYLLLVFLENGLLVNKGNDDLGSPDFDQIVTTIGSTVTFFNENKFSLAGNISFSYDYREQRADTRKNLDKTFRINIGANLRYYFNRNLY